MNPDHNHLAIAVARGPGDDAGRHHFSPEVTGEWVKQRIVVLAECSYPFDHQSIRINIPLGDCLESEKLVAAGMDESIRPGYVAAGVRVPPANEAPAIRIPSVGWELSCGLSAE